MYYTNAEVNWTELNWTILNWTELQEKRFEASSEPGISLEEECLASPALRTVDNIASQSPLNFPHCVRGRGRPKEKRQGAPRKKAEKRKAPEENFETVPEALRQYRIVPPTKKRGQPVGTKNKVKTLSPPTHKPSNRDLADPQFNQEFYDEGDICNVCGFPPRPTNLLSAVLYVQG